MRFAQRIAGLSQQVNHALGRQRAVAVDQVRQAQAGQVFHDVIKCAILGAAVIENLDGVPVREPRGRPDFALEAGQCLRVVGLVGADELDGARPLHELMLGQIDLAHAAGADQFFQPILAELAGLEGLAPQTADDVDAPHAAGSGQRQHQHDAGDVVNRHGAGHGIGA